MPYITQNQRKYLNDITVKDIAGKIGSPGELNYVISRICTDIFKENPKYSTVNDIIGALEGAKIEFYRRCAVPYEETKILENGDL